MTGGVALLFRGIGGPSMEYSASHNIEPAHSTAIHPERLLVNLNRVEEYYGKQPMTLSQSKRYV
jgi:hypothetical protein